MALNEHWERAATYGRGPGQVGISRELAQELQDLGIRRPSDIDGAELHYAARTRTFELIVGSGSWEWVMPMSRPNQLDRWYLDDMYFLLDAYEIEVFNDYPRHGATAK